MMSYTDKSPLRWTRIEDCIHSLTDPRAPSNAFNDSGHRYYKSETVERVGGPDGDLDEERMARRHVSSLRGRRPSQGLARRRSGLSTIELRVVLEVLGRENR